MNKLLRKESDFFGGFCEGLGHFFNICPGIFRIIFVIWFYFDISALIVYFLLCIIIPHEDDEEKPKKEKDD